MSTPRLHGPAAVPATGPERERSASADPWTPTSKRSRETLANYTELVEAGASRERIMWELSLTERSFQRYAAAYRAQQQQQDNEATP